MDERICINSDGNGGICNTDLLKTGVIVGVCVELMAIAEVVDDDGRVVAEKWPPRTPGTTYEREYVLCPKCRGSVEDKFPSATVYTTSITGEMKLDDEEEGT